MSDLVLTEEQQLLQSTAADFARQSLPVSRLRALRETGDGFARDLWREMGNLGWPGMLLPEEYGGLGLGYVELVAVMEQMGRYLLASPFYSTTLAAQVLLTGGREDQKRDHLPKIADGEIWTLALGEADGDWNLANVSCSATRNENGVLRLSGRKRLVRDAAVAAAFIATVKIDGEVALVIIERSQLGPDALRRETIIDETKRACSLNLEGIEIPAENRLDPADTAQALAHLHLAANLLAAAEMCGATQSCIDYTIDYLKTRTQFGKLIGSYQALKHPIVDAYVAYEQTRSHLYSAAHCFTEQGVGEIATRMAKAQADTTLSFAADRAIQFHGGFGFTYDCDAQLYRRLAIWHGSQFGDAIYHRRKLADLLL